MAEKAILTTVERRDFPLYELRVDGEGEETIIEGHAAVFNVLTEEMWGFRERIRKGAFVNTIVNDDIRALFNHDPNYVLGRNRAGTLELSEDDRGLFIRNKLPNTQYARDLVVSMRRGDITQMSFGFEVKRQIWIDDEPNNGDVLIRVLEEVKLYDVSPVTFPAYPQTDVAVRGLEEVIKQLKDGHVPAGEMARRLNALCGLEPDGAAEADYQVDLELKRKRLALQG